MVKVGDKFNRLTVTEFVGVNKNRKKLWFCKCDCGGDTVTESQSLTSGNTKSCGCYKNELASIRFKKNNKYNTDGLYGVGYTFKNEEFYFDLEDYDLIKDYCWHISKTTGYVYSSVGKNSKIAIHQLIMDTYLKDVIIDHINKNKIDNRKNNLRIASNRDNSINSSLRSDNTSGITGVSLIKRSGMFLSYYHKDGNMIRIGRFKNKTDAIVARLNAELEYYGEFAPQKHLFEIYGIKKEKAFDE